MLPSRKACLPRKASGAALVTRSLTADSTTPTTTPASSSRVVCCAPRAKVSVSSTPSSAPANAALTRPMRAMASAVARLIAWPLSALAASTSTTPSDAPEAEPSRYGSASGLRNRPCATAPASPSSAPVSQAPNVRGARIWPTMSPPSGPFQVCCNWASDQPSLPAARPAASSSSVINVRPMARR